MLFTTLLCCIIESLRAQPLFCLAQTLHQEAFIKWSVPDKEQVSGQELSKAGHLTQHFKLVNMRISGETYLLTRSKFFINSILYFKTFVWNIVKEIHLLYTSSFYLHVWWSQFLDHKLATQNKDVALARFHGLLAGLSLISFEWHVTLRLTSLTDLLICKKKKQHPLHQGPIKGIQLSWVVALNPLTLDIKEQILLSCPHTSPIKVLGRSQGCCLTGAR